MNDGQRQSKELIKIALLIIFMACKSSTNTTPCVFRLDKPEELCSFGVNTAELGPQWQEPDSNDPMLRQVDLKASKSFDVRKNNNAYAQFSNDCLVSIILVSFEGICYGSKSIKSAEAIEDALMQNGYKKEHYPAGKVLVRSFRNDNYTFTLFSDDTGEEFLEIAESTARPNRCRLKWRKEQGINIVD